MPQSPYELAMQSAAAEARRWLGATSPNPSVGAAALDADGNILAVGAHHKAGGPHAEIVTMNMCREQGRLAKITTLCVTLEPCNHQGKTPPCTEAIIAAGIKRVVIGTRDPNPHVKGGGVERLQQAGIEIVSGVAEEECRQLIHAFVYKVKSGKPFVTVKRAFDRNGSMVPPPGQKTFTSPDSLRLAHRMRKKADAIVTGSGTVVADDPLFTVRHVGDYTGKRRWLAILDRHSCVAPRYIREAKERGLYAVVYDDIHAAIADLAAKGAVDILVEAGPKLSNSLLDSDLWTMSVTLQQGEPDRVGVQFNPHAELPFDPKQFRWDYFLPQE